ncbi:hypothetical protein ABTX81_05200 [Kitasatospora sp. NPDC097605]|uniref:hypothetical protein n=1 Tax=Kitasatospora sp. NPDC097605 TaxID=3157226 RepID=UPI00331EAD37
MRVEHGVAERGPEVSGRGASAIEYGRRTRGTRGLLPGPEAAQDAEQRLGVVEVCDQRAERRPEPVPLLVDVLGEQAADGGVVFEEVLVEVLGDGGAVRFDQRETALDENGVEGHGPDSAERSGNSNRVDR